MPKRSPTSFKTNGIKYLHQTTPWGVSCRKITLCKHMGYSDWRLKKHVTSIMRKWNCFNLQVGNSLLGWSKAGIVYTSDFNFSKGNQTHKFLLPPKTKDILTGNPKNMCLERVINYTRIASNSYHSQNMQCFFKANILITLPVCKLHSPPPIIQAKKDQPKT